MQKIYENVLAAINSALAGSTQRIVDYFPNLISALLILGFGWVAATIAETLTAKVLRAIRINDTARRGGVYGVLQDAGLTQSPTTLIRKLVYWVVMILFLLPAVEALKLSYLSQLITKFVLYLPNLIVSIVILIVGLAVSRVMAASVAGSARKAGLEYASAVGLVIRYFLSLIVIILTLAQLGVQTSILTIIFAVLIISAGLALALAFGLGSRAVVANLLAGAFVRDHFPEGREIEVQGLRGRVVEVGSVGTEIEHDGRQVTIPNTILMDNVVE